MHSYLGKILKIYLVYRLQNAIHHTRTKQQQQGLCATVFNVRLVFLVSLYF